jgi:hypothetical protein
MLEQMEGSTYLWLGSGLQNPEFRGVMNSIMPVEMMHYTALQCSLARLANMMSGTPGFDMGAGTGTGTGTGGAGTGTGGTGTGTGGTGTGTGGTGTGTGAGQSALAQQLMGQGYFQMMFPFTTAERARSVLPVPAPLIPGHPWAAAVRPRLAPAASAERSVRAMQQANLFAGQPVDLVNMLLEMARAADAAAAAVVNPGSLLGL